MDKNQDPGSGIQDKHTVFAILPVTNRFVSGWGYRSEICTKIFSEFYDVKNSISIKFLMF
jgi:hypothetical protein